MQDGVFIIEQGNMLYANKKLAEMLEYSVDEIVGQPFGKFLFEDDKEMVFKNYQNRQNGLPSPDEYEFRIISKNKNVVDVRINVDTIEYEGNKISLGTLHDITQKKKTQQALIQSQSDIHSILNNIPDVFYRADIDGIITFVSPSCELELGYKPEEMIGKPMIDFYCDPSDREKILKALYEGKGKARQVHAYLRHKDGHSCWVSTNAYIRLNSDGEPIGVEGVARNMTEQKLLEDKLKKFAQIDDLTKVYNRRYFLQLCNKQLNISKRYNHSASVLMIDLDAFKKINDTYGHQYGDETLRHFAETCELHLRDSDIFGRLGGEEFAVFLPETGLEDARNLAERLRLEVKNSVLELGEKRISFSISIGVSMMNIDQDVTIERLLNQADQAMYRAKQERNSVYIFTPDSSFSQQSDA